MGYAHDKQRSRLPLPGMLLPLRGIPPGARRGKDPGGKSDAPVPPGALRGKARGGKSDAPVPPGALRGKKGEAGSALPKSVQEVGNPRERMQRTSSARIVYAGDQSSLQKDALRLRRALCTQCVSPRSASMPVPCCLGLWDQKPPERSTIRLQRTLSLRGGPRTSPRTNAAPSARSKVAHSVFSAKCAHVGASVPVPCCDGLWDQKPSERSATRLRRALSLREGPGTSPRICVAPLARSKGAHSVFSAKRPKVDKVGQVGKIGELIRPVLVPPDKNKFFGVTSNFCHFLVP